MTLVRLHRAGVASITLCLLLTVVARAESDEQVTPRSSSGSADREAVVLERAVVRFMAPETGGTESPQFVFERTLAFEARLVALADQLHRGRSDPYRRHHLQAALERHVAEVLLSSLRMTPEPDVAIVTQQTTMARAMAAQEVGGDDELVEAARREGLSRLELRSIFRRRARASLYLDRMVAPMLVPSELTLRQVHRSKKSPFSDRNFDEVRDSLLRWYVAQRLRTAAANFYQNARARLVIEYL